ncbi:ATP-dependent RNA helicase dbp2, partial [Kappamyces sp. JEL0680]
MSFGGHRNQPYANRGRGGFRGGRGGRGGFNGPARAFNDITHVYEENPSWLGIPAFEKWYGRLSNSSFYQEHPETTKLDEATVDKFRADHQMTLSGVNIPRPILKFSHSQWPAAITTIFEKNGFDTPTAIQSQGWPMALTGRNVVGIAQTGSGKTLSFVLPAILHILGQPPLQRGDGPIALVLAPTRELACQIQKVAEEYGRILDVRNSCLYGGASKGPQIGELQRTPHIVVATPGRLLDLLQMGKTTLRRVTYLVLDEADRMLDMGFEQDLRKIMHQVRPDRQLLLWSATWPKSVQKLARDFLTDDHIKVQIGSTKLMANKRINQSVQVMQEYEKQGALTKLLVSIWEKIPEPEASRQMQRTIIFANKKYLCENLASLLWEQNWSAVTIHGDKTQQERDKALADFKNGYSPILIATDVA